MLFMDDKGGRPRKTGPIDDAERHIIENPHATFASTAERFGIGIHSLRARIKNDYGSLAAARAGEPPRIGRILAPVRRCIRCSQSASIEQGARMCAKCRREVGQMHDGSV